MTEPEKTRHEKMRHHLRTATKHFAENAQSAQAAAQSHLDANPVKPLTTINEETTTEETILSD